MGRKRLIQKLKKAFGVILVYSFFFFVCIRFYGYFKNINKEHYYTLLADVKKTDELKKGAIVRLSGVNVGQISDLVLLPDFSVKVYMKISDNIFIPNDSSVAIYTDGFMGSKYVAIIPGANEDYMKNGDVFDYSQNSVNISEMLEIGIKEFQNKNDKCKDK